MSGIISQGHWKGQGLQSQSPFELRSRPGTSVLICSVGGWGARDRPMARRQGPGRLHAASQAPACSQAGSQVASQSDLDMCGRPFSTQATQLELSWGCGTPKPLWDVSLLHVGSLKFLMLIFIFSFMMGLHSRPQPALQASPLGWRHRVIPPTGDKPRHRFVTETYLLTTKQWPLNLCFYLVLLCRGPKRQSAP